MHRDLLSGTRRLTKVDLFAARIHCFQTSGSMPSSFYLEFDRNQTMSDCSPSLPSGPRLQQPLNWPTNL